MMTSMRARRLSLALALVGAGVALTAQVPVPEAVLNAPLGQVIPVDPKITTGTLGNGLRYYIRANQQPRDRAELRLTVNAGSVLEDDDQRGLAHFVEHMAFNGTTHFPGMDIVGFMQAIGMRFGAHVNAHTGFDETVYQLQIPTDNPLVIDRALLVLEDWAHNVTFDPQEIDKERGVVLEEWRLGLGADSRMLDRQMPVLLKGSRYAERLPIGKPEIIKTFTPDTLTRFYHDWYRPSLMAVMAVGDFDPAAVEALIKAHFGPMPNPASPRPRPSFDVPDHPGTLYAVTTDPEATATVVRVVSTMPARDQSTVGRLPAADARAAVRRHAVGPARRDRARSRTRRSSLPKPAAACSSDRPKPRRSRPWSPPGGAERGLAALFTESERVARFGFTQSEFDRVRMNLQRFFDQAVTERRRGGIRRPGRRVHPQLHAGRADPRHRATSTG